VVSGVVHVVMLSQQPPHPATARPLNLHHQLLKQQQWHNKYTPVILLLHATHNYVVERATMTYVMSHIQP